MQAQSDWPIEGRWVLEVQRTSWGVPQIDSLGNMTLDTTTTYFTDTVELTFRPECDSLDFQSLGEVFLWKTSTLPIEGDTLYRKIDKSVPSLTRRVEKTWIWAQNDQLHINQDQYFHDIWSSYAIPVWNFYETTGTRLN